MKKGEKIMILVLLVILVIAIIAFVGSKKQNKESNNTTENTVVEENNVVEEYVQVLEDGTKLNTSSELSKAKQVGAYKFENMQLVDVTLLDKNGKEIVKVGGIISPLQPGAKTQFNTSMTLDYANTYDFKIELKK